MPGPDRFPDPAHAADLALAAACAAGDGDALARFDEEHLSAVAGYVAHLDTRPEFVDELRQRLREKLLVAAPGQRPRIAEYGGRGALGGWLRVVSVRMALDMKRAERPAEDADPLALPAVTPDPELDLVKARYRSELAEAFRATLAALPRDERTVLRLHAVEGCSIDEIGAVLGVHRATAARWIDAAKIRLLGEVRRLLAEKLALPLAEVDSVIGLLRSRVEISLHLLQSR